MESSQQLYEQYYQQLAAAANQGGKDFVRLCRELQKQLDEERYRVTRENEMIFGAREGENPTEKLELEILTAKQQAFSKALIDTKKNLSVDTIGGDAKRVLLWSPTILFMGLAFGWLAWLGTLLFLLIVFNISLYIGQDHPFSWSVAFLSFAIVTGRLSHRIYRGKSLL